MQKIALIIQKRAKNSNYGRRRRLVISNGLKKSNYFLQWKFFDDEKSWLVGGGGYSMFSFDEMSKKWLF